MITVTRSLDRILQIGGKKYKCYAEDWETEAQAEEAASLCAVAVNYAASEGSALDGGCLLSPALVPAFGALLGIVARAKLGVDDSRPFGFAVVVEPIEEPAR